MNKKPMETRTLTGMAIFTAIVVVLQLVAALVGHVGIFSITLVLVPMVVGAALYGPGAGAWLGFVFGVVVLLSGDAGPFLAVNVLGTIVTVLAKGTLAGWLSGLVYRLFQKKRTMLAVTAAAVACPVVNTGIFLLGCLVFFLPTIREWASSFGYENVGRYMVLGLVGVNFLIEILINIVLSPVILRLIRIGQRRRT